MQNVNPKSGFLVAPQPTTHFLHRHTFHVLDRFRVPNFALLAGFEFANYKP